VHVRESESIRLTHWLGGKPETIVFSQPRVLIGRAAECDMEMPVPQVSRRHAVIERDGDVWSISDLNSRHGTFVNRQRVVNRRLEDGDEITLGLQGNAASTLEFHLPPPVEEGRVLFDDQSTGTNIHLTINVEDYERAAGAPRDDFQSGRRTSVGVEAEDQRPATLLGIAAGQAQLNRPGISIVSLFKQMGEILLTSHDLEEMLEKVVDLALANLPAQRGFICLCDEQADRITPKVTRVKGLAGGESINISRSIAREAVRARQALLVTDALADSRFANAQSIMMEGIRAAMCAPLYHAGRVEGLIYVDSLGANRFLSSDLELLTALGVLTAVGIVQARLRDDVNRERAIRARLSRYSSPHVVEQIVAGAGGLEDEMLAQQRDVSVLFADLSQFTPMVEGTDPAEVAQVLNAAFEHLTRAVFLYDGTLDKYLGDGLLAIFGAPLPQADHAERAVRAALLMQRILDEGGLTGPRGEPLRMRIGINSGTAVAGDIGSPTRKDYTVVGDAINVASRLESSVAQPGQIVIGPATFDLCKHAFDLEALPDVRLKGRQESIRPYLVVGPRPQTRPARDAPTATR